MEKFIIQAQKHVNRLVIFGHIRYGQFDNNNHNINKPPTVKRLYEIETKSILHSYKVLYII